MFRHVSLGWEEMLGPHHPRTLEMVNYLRQLDMEVTENEGQNTDVGQKPSSERDRWKNFTATEKDEG
jgi:hypothetical protein